jgi:hypothetical protein
MSLTLRAASLAALVAGALISGCSDEADPIAPAPVAAAIVEVSGDSQITQVGTPIANPLVVRVVDAAGTPMSDVSVSWTLLGDGTLTASTSTTGFDGTAQVSFTPTAAGQDTVRASVANVTVPAEFVVTAMEPSSNQ